MLLSGEKVLNEEVQSHVSSNPVTEITDTATMPLTDAECQTCSFLKDEYNRMMDELILFKQAHQDLCLEVGSLRECVDRLSISADFKKKQYTGTFLKYKCKYV